MERKSGRGLSDPSADLVPGEVCPVPFGLNPVVFHQLNSPGMLEVDPDLFKNAQGMIIDSINGSHSLSFSA